MTERPEGFAAIPNWMIRDESISIYAIAVYGALASHTGPGGVRPSQTTLAREARCSERKVRDALDELRALGVVEVVRRRRAGGKSTTLTNGYVLHPHGRLAADEESMEVPAPHAGTSGKLPAPGAGATGTSEQITPSIEEEPEKKNPSRAREAFEIFWSIYPRRVGRKVAEAKFHAAVKAGTSAEEILAGARRLRDDPNLPETQYVPHPSTWLHRGGWEDDPLPVRSNGRGPAPIMHGLSLVDEYRQREQQRGEVGA